MLLTPSGWGTLSYDQVVAEIARRKGGANIAPRLTLWTRQKQGNATVLQGSPLTSGGQSTLPLPAAMSGWHIGERIVAGDTDGQFEIPLLQSYNASTGNAVVKPALTNTWAAGAAVYQKVPHLSPVNGFDFPPAGCDDPHNSNDITRWMDSPVCTIDTTQAVTRTLAVNITERDGLHLDPEQHIVRLYCDFYDSFPNGNVMMSVPLFTGQIAQPTKTGQMENGKWQVTAHGPTFQLSSCPFMSSYATPQGASITGLLVALLTMDDIPADKNLGELAGTGFVPSGMYDAGPNFRFNQVQIPPSSAVVPYTRIFDIENTTKGQAANVMARVINCWPFYENAYGDVRTSPIPYYSQTLPVQSWAYRTDTDSIFIDPFTFDYTSLDNRPNAITMISEPAGSNGMKYTAYNTNPQSANSVPRLGRVINKTIRDDYIPDLATLILRAKLEVQIAAMQDPPVTISTLINPFHEPYDGVLVSYQNIWGPQITSSPNNLFQLVGCTWDFSQTPFTQSLKLQKIILI